MNKKIWIIFIMILFLGLIIVSAVDISKNKISKSEYASIKNKESVRVIVEFNQNKNIISSTNSINYKSNNFVNELNGKVKQAFDNKISIEIPINELENLGSYSNVKQFYLDRKFKIVLQDSVPQINSSLVWPLSIDGINLTGIDETICIIDTGVDFNHPDLIGKNKTCNIDCINKNCIENCSISDNNGHGTHVAGIVAASGGIEGVAIGANIIGVKVLDSTGSGYGSDIEKGMNWCIANANSYNISVISMSLGVTYENGTEIPYTNYCDSEYSSDLTTIINNATGRNISVVIASGNTGYTTAITAPACIQNATAVSSIRKTDSTFDFNRNSLVDLIAPGVFINSTMISSPGGTILLPCGTGKTYCVLSGTSMATPHVAGAFALVRQMFILKNNRIPSPQEIENILNSTGKQIYDSETGLNFSRIDVYSAVQSLNVSNLNLTLSPSNNTYTNQNQSYICNASGVTYSLQNITFYFYNSSESGWNLLYNESTNISGLTNSSEFFYNFSEEGNYSWGCIVYNNISETSYSGNYSIFYDLTNPNITALSVSPSSSSATITLNSNEAINYSLNYGTSSNLGSISNSSSFSSTNSIYISGLSASSTHYYNVSLCDRAGNCIVNGTNTFSTSAAEAISSSSSGGGGGSISQIYSPTTAELISGYTKTLSKNDKIKFIFFDKQNENHTLTLNQIGSDFVNITIKSEPIDIKLGVGQSIKLNLSSSDYYDFYLKLNSITNGKADLTIQTIYEKIDKMNTITGNSVNKLEDDKDNDTITDLNKKVFSLKTVVYALTLMFIILIIFVIFRENKLHKIEITKKEYKEKFQKHIKPRKKIGK